MERFAHGGGGAGSRSEEKKKSSTNDTAQDKMKAHSNQSLKPAEETFEKKLAEVKRDVLNEAHQLLESIFTKTFDSKCTNTAKVLRTHEVYVAVNALRDFGAILASYNLCIALVILKQANFMPDLTRRTRSLRISKMREEAMTRQQWC